MEGRLHGPSFVRHGCDSGRVGASERRLCGGDSKARQLEGQAGWGVAHKDKLSDRRTSSLAARRVEDRACTWRREKRKGKGWAPASAPGSTLCHRGPSQQLSFPLRPVLFLRPVSCGSRADSHSSLHITYPVSSLGKNSLFPKTSPRSSRVDHDVARSMSRLLHPPPKPGGQRAGQRAVATVNPRGLQGQIDPTNTTCEWRRGGPPRKTEVLPGRGLWMLGREDSPCPHQELFPKPPSSF